MIVPNVLFLHSQLNTIFPLLHSKRGLTIGNFKNSFKIDPISTHTSQKMTHCLDFLCKAEKIDGQTRDLELEWKEFLTAYAIDTSLVETILPKAESLKTRINAIFRQVFSQLEEESNQEDMRPLACQKQSLSQSNAPKDSLEYQLKALFVAIQAGELGSPLAHKLNDRSTEILNEQRVLKCLLIYAIKQHLPIPSCFALKEEEKLEQLLESIDQQEVFDRLFPENKETELKELDALLNQVTSKSDIQAQFGAIQDSLRFFLLDEKALSPSYETCERLIAHKQLDGALIKANEIVDTEEKIDAFVLVMSAFIKKGDYLQAKSAIEAFENTLRNQIMANLIWFTESHAFLNFANTLSASQYKDAILSTFIPVALLKKEVELAKAAYFEIKDVDFQIEATIDLMRYFARKREKQAFMDTFRPIKAQELFKRIAIAANHLVEEGNFVEFTSLLGFLPNHVVPGIYSLLYSKAVEKLDQIEQDALFLKIKEKVSKNTETQSFEWHKAAIEVLAKARQA